MEQNQNCVYIGNIPYDYTEEQVLEIAKSVGPVKDLRLLFDAVTGKSKGYAFVRYGDRETAESAVRNLSSFTIGNRILKCSISNEATPFDLTIETDRLPPLPLGVQIYPNQNTGQVISSLLSTLDENTALQLIREAKDMCATNPGLMQKLLEKTPQLAHALVEVSLLLNLTDRDTVDVCINKQKQEIERLSPEQIQLLQIVKDLDDASIEDLEKSKQEIIMKLKDDISNGSFGEV